MQVDFVSVRARHGEIENGGNQIGTMPFKKRERLGAVAGLDDVRSLAGQCSSSEPSDRLVVLGKQYLEPRADAPLRFGLARAQVARIDAEVAR